jgi:hypothetical protein
LSTFDIDYYETLKSSNNRATNLKELLSIWNIFKLLYF